jgi:hypothetical protein
MTDLCPRPLRRAEAAAYLLEKHGIQRKPATLAKLAVLGGGPVFRRAGRVPLYSPADLDEFAAKITSAPVHSTSELRNRLQKQRGAAEPAP